MKYKVIYADPPWHYKDNLAKTLTGDSRVKNQYPTMSNDELINFPINDFADDNCVLFMWVTIPKLQFGLELLKIWGFIYKTCLVWNKQFNKRGGNGMGSYFQINTEFLLMGIRGKIKQWWSGKSNIINAEWRGHSVKPQQFRTLIELCTKGLEPKIELFARKKAYGWSVFGNDDRLNHESLDMFNQTENSITKIIKGNGK